MTDKNWQDSLRQRMSEHKETPPEGLWEALEAAGAVGEAADGRGAGRAAAGAGLLGWLFGSRWAPAWWSLAGVAAAVGAVLLLTPPSKTPDIVVANPSNVAQVDISEPEDDSPDAAPAFSGESANSPAGTAATEPVEAAASAYASVDFAAPGVSGVSGVPGTKSARSGSDLPLHDGSQSAVANPANPVPSGSDRPVPSGSGGNIVPTEVQPSQEQESAPAQEVPKADQPSPEQESAPAQEVPKADQPSPEQESAPAIEPAGQAPATEEPVTSPVVPKASSPAPGRTVVPIGRSVKRNRPLFAATLMGGGMPAGADIHNTVEYGMRTSLNKPGVVRQASMLSRNRITETITSRKMDYQVGLMASLDITRHWGIETGIQYTRLGSSIVSNSGSISSTTEEKINYIGIPLHVVYTPVQLRLLSVYLSAGPEVEYGLSRSWRVQDMIDAVPTVKDGGTDHPGDFVFSGSLNAGVQVHPFRHGAFFLQPGVVFRHTGDSSVASYYTDHPVSFRLSAGYRITF